MNVELKIDAEAVQNQLVAAIINSGIGEQIEKSISSALEEKTGDWNNKKTLVQRAIDDVLTATIRKLAIEVIESKKEAIRAQLLEKMTDEVLSQMINSSWAIIDAKINN